MEPFLYVLPPCPFHASSEDGIKSSSGQVPSAYGVKGER